ncbi:MAG: hypothetical protein A2X64_06840 [Ignavibacteria bacterium GWF2_33_9]|nr:MAG: hypothetical protein A2X64_06840 [Ignavibacteria bacterium GWF2_33_9]
MIKNIIIALLLFAFLMNLDARTIAYVNSTNEIDFDTVYPQRIEKKIFLINKGDEVLKISSLSASCGCTILSALQDSILPNDSQEILVKYNLQRTSGRKIFHLYINTNDSIHPKLDITTKMFVYRDVEVTPKKLPSYIGLKKGDTISCLIKIKNNGRTDVLLKNPSNSKPDLVKILSFQNSDTNLKPNSEAEFNLKLEILKDERIAAEIRIPTTSVSVPIIEYLFITSK